MAQGKTMWQVAVLYSAVLFSTSLVDGQSCTSDAVDNCTFAMGLNSCRWTFDVNDWNYANNSAVLGVNGQQEQQNLTSGTVCFKEDDRHCLQVRYFFDVKNMGMRVILIPVRVEDEGDDSGELAAWNGTDAGIGVWHTTSIHIQSKGKFNFTVEARKFTEGIGKLYIHYIHYIKAPCSTLPTSTVPSTLTSTPKERTTIIDSHVSTDALNDVGVVVGVVVAVIVIAVAVVIFILYRRKQLHPWKTCFRNANEKDATGTSHTREHDVGKDGKRVFHSINATTTVSGINNHAFTASESQSSDTYYSVIKNTDYAMSHYSTVQESKSADSKNVPNSSKCTDDDPYEIMAENGHFLSQSAATKNSNANFKGKAGINGNYLPPASNGGNRKAPSDYSLARDTGGKATGVYHCLEEDPNNHGEGGDTGLYHYAKDPDMNPEAGADAKGVYHILEEDPAISRDEQSLGVYHEPKVEQTGQRQRTAKVSKGLPGNYNTLDFVGKSSDLKTHEDGSGGVYNHLGAESDDPYNEVDRDVRLEVIDGEYSHIKLSDC